MNKKGMVLLCTEHHILQVILSPWMPAYAGVTL